MQFVFPLFLVALASILIPVIIHLFYFQRYRTEYFSNVQFLKDVVEEKQTRSRLRDLLILLSRIFFITFLVLAFAQPFLQDKEKSDQSPVDYVSIYIDNSYSMEALSSETPIFQVAVNRAKEIIRSYPEGTSFQILTNHLSPIAARRVDQDMALKIVDEIDLSSETADLDQIYQFLKRSEGGENQNVHAYWLSDFQKNALTDPIDVDRSIQVFPVPIHPVETRNISIDSSWFESPVPEANIENRLFIKLTNYGSSGTDTRIVMRDDGETKPVSTLFIEAGRSVIDTIGIQLGREAKNIILEVMDQPITFDNHYYLSLNARKKLRIMIIDDGDQNRYLQSAFSNQPTVEKTFVSTQRLIYSEFDRQDLIILDDLSEINTGLASNLIKYIKNGGNVLLFPSPKSTGSGFDSMLSQIGAVGMGDWIEENQDALQINYEDFVFSDVFEDQRSNLSLPSVKGYYNISTSSRAAATSLIGLRNGRPLISKIAHENGYLFLSSSPLSGQWNNLANHADIFIPMLYRMALSRSKQGQLAYFIGEDNEIMLTSEQELKTEKLEIRSKDLAFIPGYHQAGDMVELFIHDQIKEAGFYDVYDGENQIASFAMNYNRKESDIELWDIQELEEKITGNVVFVNSAQQASLGKFIQEFEQGKVFWRYCLIFALIFLIMEGLLIRFFKN